jgi:hypothetical protein
MYLWTHICGMSANLTNYLGPKTEDLQLTELICGPPTFAKNMKGSLQIDRDCSTITVLRKNTKISAI